MNEIVKSYMEDFKQNEGFDNTLSDSIAFEYFINYLVVKKDFSDDFNIESIHTGGSNDIGIDGVAIVVNKEVCSLNDNIEEFLKDKQKLDIDFIFIQSKTSTSFDNGDLLKFLHGVEYFFNEDKNEKENKNKNIFLKIKKAIYDKATSFSSHPNLHIKYAYNGKKNNMQDCDMHIKKFKNTFASKSIFSEINIDILDCNDIQAMYKEITLNIEKEINLEKITTLPKINNIQEAYIGIIPLTEFVRLISNDNNKIIKNLFYDNVRDYQGDTSINIGIADTLKYSSMYFGLCHNGITVISKNLRKVGDKFYLRSFQIVNGCQTSHIVMQNIDTLSEEDKAKVFIPIKIIISQDDNILNSIIVAANTHNEIKRESFEALNQFHKSLEEFYNSKRSSSCQFYYERRSKQYSHDNTISKKYIVSLADQIKAYLSMFYNNPHSTHRHYGKLLNSYKNKIGMFENKNNNEYFDLYYISGVFLKKVDLFFYEGKINQKYKPYKYHILFICKLLLSKKLSNKLNMTEYKKQCNIIYDILKDDIKLLECFSNACKIIEQDLSNTKYNNHHRNIRVKGFTIRLEKAVSSKV